MPQTLNDIERKILDFMVYYLRDNTYQPSIREIGERFDIKSTKTVSEHLQSLAQKGFLERDPSRSRGVKILSVDLHANTVSIPCYADFPDNRGGKGAERFLTIDRELAGSKGSFFVRAQADDAAVMGVEEGDWLLVAPVQIDQIDDGAAVVVRTEGRPGFYRFQRSDDGPQIEALGPGGDGAGSRTFDPMEMELVGRVSALFRRMDGVRQVPASLTAH